MNSSCVTASVGKVASVRAFGSRALYEVPFRDHVLFRIGSISSFHLLRHVRTIKPCANVRRLTETCVTFDAAEVCSPLFFDRRHHRVSSIDQRSQFASVASNRSPFVSPVSRRNQHLLNVSRTERRLKEPDLELHLHENWFSET